MNATTQRQQKPQLENVPKERLEDQSHQPRTETNPRRREALTNSDEPSQLDRAW